MKCKMTLSCGHECTKKCKEPCESKCKKLVPTSSIMACNHVAFVKCYKRDLYKGNSLDIIKKNLFYVYEVCCLGAADMTC
jgi:hypothetical protein